MAQIPEVTGFFDRRTGSIQYVVADPKAQKCAIIDPVYDFDEKSGHTASMNADRILEFVRHKHYSVEWKQLVINLKVQAATGKVAASVSQPSFRADSGL